MSDDGYKQRRAEFQKERRKAVKDTQADFMEDEIDNIIAKAFPCQKQPIQPEQDEFLDPMDYDYSIGCFDTSKHDHEDSDFDITELNSKPEERVESDECLPPQDVQSPDAIHVDESCKTVVSKEIQAGHQEYDFLTDSAEDNEEMGTDPLPQRPREDIVWEEDENNTVDSQLANAIAVWSLEHKIKREAVSNLLKILNENGHPSICKCSKTLLRTPRSTVDLIKDVSNGKFWYYGIAKSMQKRLSAYLKNCQEKKITIDVFADGLQIYRSVNREVWPLLGCLKGESKPFLIAVWCGESKEPEDVDGFWKDFIDEADHLMKDGFSFENETFQFEIRYFHGDALARAWFKKTAHHTSPICCERCTIRARWFLHRMIYDPEEVGQLRSDVSFRDQTQQDYHKGFSPLLKLSAKLISQVPLDPMHLCDLGAMKRWFQRLTTKKKGRYKLRGGVLDEISKLLGCLVEYLPSEFCRTKRSSKDWGLLTAKEYRRMMLYDGFLLFNRTPHPELFKSFCLLGCAMRILTDRSLVQDFADDANVLLKEFVKNSVLLFGETFVVYNIHHLTHLADECKMHGSLDDFSCYKYESYLHEIKLTLSAPGRTLPQLICRTMEAVATLPNQEPVIVDHIRFERPHQSGPTLGNCSGQQFRKLTLGKCLFRILSRNDCFCLTKNGEVVWIQNIVKSSDKSGFVIGQKFSLVRNYFTYPLPSSLLGIYVVHKLERLSRWSLDDIKKKVLIFPFDMISLKEDSSWNDMQGLCIEVLHTSTETDARLIDDCSDT